MNHLRNMCANKRLKYISNDVELMFDTKDVADLAEIREMLRSNDQTKFELAEVQSVPQSLKEEYFRGITDRGRTNGRGAYDDRFSGHRERDYDAYQGRSRSFMDRPRRT